MWNDDNEKIDDIYRNFVKIEKFPAICPVCRKKGGHIYMDIHNHKTRRGGLWVWCSECYAFSHSSFYVPGYWQNCSAIDAEKLCAIPIYLNEMKDKIDEHVNSIIKNYAEKTI